MKTVLLLFCVAAALPAQGQSATTRGEAPFQSVSGAFFALSVADVAQSAKWYTEKFGLRIVMDVPKRDRVAATILEGNGLIVELIHHDDAAPLKTAAPGARGPQFVHGIFKVGIVVQDFERTLANLRARGVEIAYGPYPKREQQRANFVVRDNFGNLIQFFGQ